MTKQYAAWGVLAGGLALLVAPAPARAQAPTVVATAPAAQAVAVPRTSPVEFTFSQPLTAASAAALKVYSSQRGGLRTATAPVQVVGGTLRFTPAAFPFLPGETVQAVATRAATGTGGALARGRVLSFTAATRPTRPPNFQTTATLPVGPNCFAVALGDVDGDGDLDLAAATFDNGPTDLVSVHLNGGDASGSNTGTFGSPRAVPVGDNPYSVALADVDGDGDLDLVTACGNGPTLSVRLNGGNASGSNTGLFSGGQDLPLSGLPYDAAVGDVDGDGDLDVVTASLMGTTATVCLNGGNAASTATGVFTAQPVTLPGTPSRLTLGDVDNDGDLDLLATCSNPDVVSVRLNGGDATGSNTGVFSNGQTLALSSPATKLTLGDVDRDGNPDLLVLLSPNTGPGALDVWLNGGTAGGAPAGTFARTASVPVGTTPYAVALGDVEGDGDLDAFVTCLSSNNLNVVLNVGNGTFVNTSSIITNNTGVALALGDVDGDGDLDLVRANTAGGSVVVVLNRAAPLAVASPAAPAALLAAPNPASGRVALTLPPAASSAELLDALGRPVRTVPAVAGAATLDVTGLAPGLYLLRAAGQTARLVVE